MPNTLPPVACAVPATAVGRPSRPGFTLIEMLVVILIIAILSGMVFGMIRMVGRNADRAKTRRTIELLASAVEEFRAEYGKYPPVPEYPNPDSDVIEQPMIYEYAHEDLIEEGRVLGISGNDGRLFTFGLLSFLTPRYTNAAAYSPSGALATSQWRDHNQSQEDRPRDLRATKRFQPYLDPILAHDIVSRKAGGTTYTNRIAVVRDAWYRSLRYRSTPPYETYRLWSVGPDGEDAPCPACTARIQAGNAPLPDCKACAARERDNIVAGTE